MQLRLPRHELWEVPLTLPRKKLWDAPDSSVTSSSSTLVVPPRRRARRQPAHSTLSGRSSSSPSRRRPGQPKADARLHDARDELAAIIIQNGFWRWRNSRGADVEDTESIAATSMCSGADSSMGSGSADDEWSAGLADGWEAVTAEDGRVYFWNTITDETSWGPPQTPAQTPSTPPAPLSPTTSLASATSARDGALAYEDSGISIQAQFAETSARAAQDAHAPVWTGTPRHIDVRGQRTSTLEHMRELNTLRGGQHVSGTDAKGMKTALARLYSGPKRGRLPKGKRDGWWELCMSKPVSSKSAAFRDELGSVLLQRGRTQSELAGRPQSVSLDEGLGQLHEAAEMWTLTAQANASMERAASANKRVVFGGEEMNDVLLFVSPYDKDRLSEWFYQHEDVEAFEADAVREDAEGEWEDD